MLSNYLICVGAPKSGTTMFSTLLKQHPVFCLPSAYNEKATNFFTNRYPYLKNGIDWYFKQFAHCSPDQIACEVCPSYFSDPLSPKLISKSLSDAKLLVLLRDPVKRSFSSFLNNKRAGRVPKNMSFWEATKTRENILYDSKYDIHINRYLRYFDRTSLYWIFLDDLIQDADKEIRKLCNFLGVGLPNFPIKMKSVNAARIPKYYALERFYENSVSVIHKARLSKLVQIVKKLRFTSFLKRLNSSTTPIITEELYRDLSEYFKPNNRRLAQLLSLKYMPWEDSL